MAKIVLDAMGGDYAPQEIVAGGVLAARDLGVQVVLVGRKDAIDEELKNHDTSGLSLEIVHAEEVIEMTDSPATAARHKTQSSMHVGMRLIKSGEADGFVTMGNSGGALATALFVLGRIPGVKRPALATIYPTIDGYTFLLDVGANADCKPEYLHQFAIMGNIYVRDVLGVENPRIGIISNGEERGKGNKLMLDTVPLLENTPDLNFVGNVEGKDVTHGVADVVVMDGFTGNVLLKTSEGIAWMLGEMIKQEVKKSPIAILGALLMKGAMKRVLARTDYKEYGGAPLLGVNGNVVVGHGRSNRVAVRNAIRVARAMVEQNVIDSIKTHSVISGETKQ
jgi:glycerol-3-phosphate acyltransferase PlsX